MWDEWPPDRQLRWMIWLWIAALWAAVIATAVFGERALGTTGHGPADADQASAAQEPAIDPAPPADRSVSRRHARTASAGEWQTWTASWYGEESGSVTASGERFDPQAMTAAHRTLPFGTRLEVCYGGRCVVVRVNDRGPYVPGRDLDLSRGAAEALGMTEAGVAPVQVRIVGEE
ncbi:rare lipoprotein A [Thermaerobacter marianensis DSM 12885]|uniref:Probable endolytic peptidoglycan transglycosylase RlpA n=1 Tax=Thermaerobacter marianensis (strain ATCC 700841 / DSM 12885 / JCM 10246 / 7p75a) TaxID=644966 RepID=E6SKG1_THEM7|nr:septal ring lytic transglycosylase RlpA family protein [Thermaerobacter marianensis]ADU50148.1 rare lipoprotein A [Thermaerobacter marianensis DSM 12885]